MDSNNSNSINKMNKTDYSNSKVRQNKYKELLAQLLEVHYSKLSSKNTEMSLLYACYEDSTLNGF